MDASRLRADIQNNALNASNYNNLNMKNITLLFAILIFSIPLFGQEDWAIVESGTSEKLNKILFIDDEKGFIVGDNGILLMTENGGMNWELINTNVTHDLKTITFADDLNGFINGLITTDGGITWTPQSASTDYGLIAAFSIDNLLAGSNSSFSGDIYQSTDQGGAWNSIGSPIAAGFYTDVFFTNSNTAYLSSWYSGHLIKTIDGGASWTENTAILDLIDDIYGLDFPSEDIGIVAAAPAQIVKTIDGGDTWSSIYPSTGDAFFLSRGIFCRSTTDYIIVGNTTESSTSTHKIYQTVDGGITWEMVNDQTDNLNDVYCTSSNCFAVGESGAIVQRGLILSADNPIQKLSYKIYPNPTTDYINIDFDQVQDIEIYDNLGRRLLSKTVLQEQLNIGDWAAGLYFIRVLDENKINTAIPFLKE